MHTETDTLTTTTIDNAFLNAPIHENKVIPVAMPQILVRLGVAKPERIWQVGRDADGLKESPRLWREGGT
eukprot:4738838-Prorocentrum_lima.AAC.1